MKLSVQRKSQDGGVDRVDSFEVPESEGMTVLDALLWVREFEDPTVGVRFSCRRANACKECLAVVNGQRTYTCIVPATGEVLVEPLSHKPLVRDLATRL
ncbi:2Fe-2S iron-sulfur cluster-binding protein [Nocardioides soli]|uniref:Succinate dehydrogenase/fumarate reductase-like Fe-S protein n=1 Tax=Nocardioides soli TaxID=1036020 RepID=A0A7W4VU27_9ACTN|nr:2Fe-2S iron-sulfur cluster-binding protein [Nocardioides soli]MBB3041771.1 succinate dehydrogenase/fumarate reductase-like Fe-S protein [Nocardioides soli]